MVDRNYVKRGFLTRELTIIDEMGLHARPSAYTCKLTCQYPEKIEAYMEKIGAETDNIVNMRSIMGLMTLEAGQHSRMRIYIKEGFAQSETMLEELSEFLSGDFENVRTEKPAEPEKRGLLENLF
jgi:phosphotransferase system HPr (HPr) family protein